MARQGISESDVLQAIEALQTAGQEITPTNIRKRLGTGSYTTISSAITKWKAEQLRTSTIPEMPDAVRVLTRKLWEVTWTAAVAAHAAERELFAKAKADLGRQAEEMKAEIKRLESEVSELQSSSTTATKALAKERGEHEQLKLESQRLRGRLEVLETALQRAQTEAETARKDLTSWVERATKAETATEASRKPEKPH